MLRLAANRRRAGLISVTAPARLAASVVSGSLRPVCEAAAQQASASQLRQRAQQRRIASASSSSASSGSSAAPVATGGARRQSRRSAVKQQQQQPRRYQSSGRGSGSNNDANSQPPSSSSSSGSSPTPSSASSGSSSSSTSSSSPSTSGHRMQLKMESILRQARGGGVQPSALPATETGSAAAATTTTNSSSSSSGSGMNSSTSPTGPIGTSGSTSANGSGSGVGVAEVELESVMRPREPRPTRDLLQMRDRILQLRSHINEWMRTVRNRGLQDSEFQEFREQQLELAMLEREHAGLQQVMASRGHLEAALEVDMMPGAPGLAPGQPGVGGRGPNMPGSHGAGAAGADPGAQGQGSPLYPHRVHGSPDLGYSGLYSGMYQRGGHAAAAMGAGRDPAADGAAGVSEPALPSRPGALPTSPNATTTSPGSAAASGASAVSGTAAHASASSSLAAAGTVGAASGTTNPATHQSFLSAATSSLNRARREFARRGDQRLNPGGVAGMAGIYNPNIPVGPGAGVGGNTNVTMGSGVAGAAGVGHYHPSVTVKAPGAGFGLAGGIPGDASSAATGGAAGAGSDAVGTTAGAGSPGVLGGAEASAAVAAGEGSDAGRGSPGLFKFWQTMGWGGSSPTAANRMMNLVGALGGGFSGLGSGSNNAGNSGANDNSGFGMSENGSPIAPAFRHNPAVVGPEAAAVGDPAGLNPQALHHPFRHHSAFPRAVRLTRARVSMGEINLGSVRSAAPPPASAQNEFQQQQQQGGAANADNNASRRGARGNSNNGKPFGGRAPAAHEFFARMAQESFRPRPRGAGNNNNPNNNNDSSGAGLGWSGGYQRRGVNNNQGGHSGGAGNSANNSGGGGGNGGYHNPGFGYSATTSNPALASKLARVPVATRIRPDRTDPYADQIQAQLAEVAPVNLPLAARATVTLAPASLKPELSRVDRNIFWTSTSVPRLVPELRHVISETAGVSMLPHTRFALDEDQESHRPVYAETGPYKPGMELQDSVGDDGSSSSSSASATGTGTGPEAAAVAGATDSVNIDSVNTHSTDNSTKSDSSNNSNDSNNGNNNDLPEGLLPPWLLPADREQVETLREHGGKPFGPEPVWKPMATAELQFPKRAVRLPMDDIIYQHVAVRTTPEKLETVHPHLARQLEWQQANLEDMMQQQRSRGKAQFQAAVKNANRDSNNGNGSSNAAVDQDDAQAAANEELGEVADGYEGDYGLIGDEDDPDALAAAAAAVAGPSGADLLADGHIVPEDVARELAEVERQAAAAASDAELTDDGSDVLSEDDLGLKPRAGLRHNYGDLSDVEMAEDEDEEVAVVTGVATQDAAAAADALKKAKKLKKASISAVKAADAGEDDVVDGAVSEDATDSESGVSAGAGAGATGGAGSGMRPETRDQTMRRGGLRWGRPIHPFYEAVDQSRSELRKLVPPFVPPSRDAALLRDAARHGVRMVSSTSSSTSILSQLYFVVSQGRGINHRHFSPAFSMSQFTRAARMPAVAQWRLRRAGGKPVWAIDAGFRPSSGSTRLLDLGHILEMKFTMPRDEFAYHARQSFPPPRCSAVHNQEHLAAWTHPVQNLDQVEAGLKADMESTARASMEYAELTRTHNGLVRIPVRGQAGASSTAKLQQTSNKTSTNNTSAKNTTNANSANANANTSVAESPAQVSAASSAAQLDSFNRFVAGLAPGQSAEEAQETAAVTSAGSQADETVKTDKADKAEAAETPAEDDTPVDPLDAWMDIVRETSGAVWPNAAAAAEEELLPGYDLGSLDEAAESTDFPGMGAGSSGAQYNNMQRPGGRMAGNPGVFTEHRGVGYHPVNEIFARRWNRRYRSHTERSSYLHSKINNLWMVRSQLDVHEPDAPTANRVFDVKTRALMPIRMSPMDHVSPVPYEMTQRYGFLYSVEREWHDMTRATFLKYSFQARLGNMAGVIVAYHNTHNIYGYEAVTLRQMEDALAPPHMMARVYPVLLNAMTQISQRIMDDFPDEADLQVSYNYNRPTHTLSVLVERLIDDASWEQLADTNTAQLYRQVDNTPTAELRERAASIGIEVPPEITERTPLVWYIESQIKKRPVVRPNDEQLRKMAEAGLIVNYEVQVTNVVDGAVIPREVPLNIDLHSSWQPSISIVRTTDPGLAVRRWLAVYNYTLNMLTDLPSADDVPPIASAKRRSTPPSRRTIMRAVQETGGHNPYSLANWLADTYNYDWTVAFRRCQAVLRTPLTQDPALLPPRVPGGVPVVDPEALTEWYVTPAAQEAQERAWQQQQQMQQQQTMQEMQQQMQQQQQQQQQEIDEAAQAEAELLAKLDDDDRSMGADLDDDLEAYRRELAQRRAAAQAALEAEMEADEVVGDEDVDADEVEDADADAEEDAHGATSRM